MSTRAHFVFLHTSKQPDKASFRTWLLRLHLQCSLVQPCIRFHGNDKRSWRRDPKALQHSSW
eukprot:TsM_000270200 transcript=TsM_000270200 gene=TsM_000270200